MCVCVQSTPAFIANAANHRIPLQFTTFLANGMAGIKFGWVENLRSPYICIKKPK